MSSLQTFLENSSCQVNVLRCQHSRVNHRGENNVLMQLNCSQPPEAEEPGNFCVMVSPAWQSGCKADSEGGRNV